MKKTIKTKATKHGVRVTGMVGADLADREDVTVIGGAIQKNETKQALMKKYGVEEGTTNGKRCFYAPGGTPRSIIDQIAKL